MKLKNKFSNIEPELNKSIRSNASISSIQMQDLGLVQSSQRGGVSSLIKVNHNRMAEQRVQCSQRAFKIFDKQEVQIKRKSFPLFGFFLMNFIMFILSFQNIIAFFIMGLDGKTYFMMGSLTTSAIIMICISRYFVTLRQMFMYYFLLDTVLLALISSMIGLYGMVNTAQQMFPQYTEMLRILAPLAAFSVAGSVRVIIKHANFSRWQNIMFKIVIFADGLCYFMIAVYIMYSDYKISSGMKPQMDSYYKDFALLFSFGGLAFYKQLCKLHNRFDHTSRLKYKYKLIDEVQQEQSDQ